jgi:hypothetical protein
MSPVMKAKVGMAAPIAAEQIVQKIMRMIYFSLANRNRDKKDTELTVCYYATLLRGCEEISYSLLVFLLFGVYISIKVILLLTQGRIIDKGSSQQHD